MLKKVILTALFFIIATGIFGSLTPKVHAQSGVSCTTSDGWPGTCTGKINCAFTDIDTAWDDSIPVCNSIPFALSHMGCCGSNPNPVRGSSCTSDQGWPGTCTLTTECNKSNGNIEWNDLKCKGDYGCCGTKPGTPEDARPGLGQSCTASNGWSGTCTTNRDCNQTLDNITYDISACKASGCCGTKPGTTTVKSCTAGNGWPGFCTLPSECNKENGNIVFDNLKCLGGGMGLSYGCCGTKPGTPEDARPGLGQSCQTSDGWLGTCTTNLDCNQSLTNVKWDIKTCKASGCCGTKAANIIATTRVCDFAAGSSSQKACQDCMGDGKHAWTALGCIPSDPALFIGQVIGIAVGIGGGIAFLLILFGGFQILMSAGNPERLNAGKELVTSAITGLLIIIFSIFILRLIGVTILGIPGFS